MKIKPLIFALFLFISAPLFLSCSDDDGNEDDQVAEGCSTFEQEYQDVLAALTTYSENPSSTTCEAYKSALIEFYESFSDCPYWGSTYQEAVDEVQQMDCSDIDENM